jgi:hypothetical protein
MTVYYMRPVLVCVHSRLLGTNALPPASHNFLASSHKEHHKTLFGVLAKFLRASRLTSSPKA